MKEYKDDELSCRKCGKITPHILANQTCIKCFELTGNKTERCTVCGEQKNRLTCNICERTSIFVHKRKKFMYGMPCPTTLSEL